MVGCGILQKVTRLCLVLGVLISTSSCKFFDRDANYISKDKVWKKIRSEAPKLGLEPSFVFAIYTQKAVLMQTQNLPLPRV